ncbi:TerD family protein [Streptomyces sp. NPDC002896]|uniref:TerD family protein n=1 Tax=Streptomyces sp. NPDC002896 TaxID=3154438 RepID=UPI00331FA51B
MGSARNELLKGGNTPLPGPRAVLTVHTSVPVDVSALLLTSEGKVRGDDDLVFFNHPEQDGIAVDGLTMTADLARIPGEIQTVALTASIDVDQPGTSFEASSTPRVEIESAHNRLSFAPPPLTSGETVLVIAELYRRGDGWKVRAVGQGYANGLAGVAADFGIVVGDEPAPEPPAAPVTPQTLPSPVPQPTPTAAPLAPLAQPAVSKVPLGKIELTKAGAATISLNKADPAVLVTASLEWDGGTRGSRGADLDLYALFVPASTVRDDVRRDDRRREEDEAEDDPAAGSVYWNNRGFLDKPPYIALDQDAKKPGCETVRIKRPDQQGYLLICAYSAVSNGTGSFKSFGARAVVSDGAGSTVTVPLYSENDNAYWVAIALVDFTDPAGVKISQVEKYSKRHSESRPMLYSDGEFKMDRGPIEFKD